MDFSKRKFIGNAFFFSSQFNYGPLIWMYHSVYTKTSAEILQKKTHIKGQRHFFLRNQRDFVISTVKSVKYDWKALGFLDQIYGTAFKKN